MQVLNRGSAIDPHHKSKEVSVMKKIVLSASMVITALFMVTVIGLTQDQDVHGKGPCKADVEKFCKGIKPGGGRIWACLKSHGSELAPACTDHMTQAREKGKDFMKACKADVKKFCKGIPRGKGRIMSCLKSHETELDAPCKAYFDKN
jgi:hypothetical protein